MQTPQPHLKCIRADGVEIVAKLPGTGGTGAGAGVTLASGTTYYFPFGGSDVPLESIHLKWDAAIIITTATIEDGNFPLAADGNGNTDVANHDATAGNWIPERPTTAYVPVVGAGAVVTNAQLAVAGGAAGGAIWHLGNFGTKRGRLAVVVGGTGGLVRCHGHGKG